MFKNKHIIVALLVAPVLAIIAYFAVDYMVAERPHAAQADATYKLVAKPNCRYPSGACELKNGEFELTLKPAGAIGDQMTLRVEASFPLSMASLGVASAPGESTSPIALAADDAEGRLWSTTIATPKLDEAAFQIAVVADRSRFYAEVPTVFLAADDGPDWSR